MRYSLCNHWEFTEQWSDAFCRGEPVGCRPVRLPHTCRELPLHYADPSDYEMVCGYRRTLTVPDAPRVFLRFDGAAHQAEIYLNGQLAGQHQGGYTGFTIEITDLVHRGTENLLAVRLDTREDPSLPPFGFVIDYLTYGGLYREVWLETSPQSRVSDLFVYTPTLTEATVQLTVEAPEKAAALRVRLCSSAGKTLVSRQLSPAESAECRLTLPDAAPWDTEHPNLYRCIAELLDTDGQVLHSRETSFGFRTAVFRADGFYLNGKKICGILTEAVSDFESGRIDTVVVGIGINYHAPKEGYPDEIKEIAGTVCAEDEKIPRNELVAAIIENLCKLYQDLPDKSFMEDYRKWSNVLGKKIRFTSGTDWEYGTAVAIDEDGGLIVEKEDHTQEILHTGEITVRVC